MAAVWLAGPLVALMVSGCGDDSTAAAPDAGADLTPQEAAEQAAESVCGDSFVTHDEECEEGPNCTDACVENTCGDGFEGPGEACDDGNTLDGDACPSNCVDPDCGDGVVADGEECDDANRTNDDACSNACESADCGDGIVQAASEECDEGSDTGDEGNGCTAECLRNECGDGHVGPGEACDDMNAIDDDECTNDCGLPGCGDGIVQGNEECDEANSNDRDACLSSCVENVCGDGIVLAGVEACDDGNSSNVDSCTNACASASCGDGFVGPNESCDDGADNADDGACTTTCAPSECGNGVVQPGEECDDGNGSNTDDCSNNCVSAKCGDGIRQGDEVCDDANTSNADACTNGCYPSECGDGVVGPGQACDDGNLIDGDGCQADCSLPTCGDGIVDSDEECDDANSIATDSCLDTCLWNRCGDGVAYTDVSDDANTNPVEECDDGNTDDADACTNSCANAACGDGVRGPGEGCDDGNAVDGDGCNACVPGDCGNGVVDPGELCDDGNANEADECLSTCAPASCGDGYTHFGEEGCDDGNSSNADACLNTCVDASCGDGVVHAGVEACDLGAGNGPGAICTTSCTMSDCGDGALDPGEECDDANHDNNDSCTTNCLWNACGDGAVYIAETESDNPNDLEECDDANVGDGDLCLSTCTYNRCADGELLTDPESEPYDDPDGTGVRTASRGGLNDPFHSGGEDPDNLTSALLNDDGHGDDDETCDPGEPCRVGRLDEAGVVPMGSALSTVDVDFIDDEECDDGNLINTDACLARNEDADPERECRTARCSDGVVQAGVEQCDDGCGPLIAEEDCDALRNQSDSCLETCELNTCGDGWVYTTNTSGSATPTLEECDDGNAANDDACRADCSIPICGNGVLDFSINPDGTLRLEQCDEGTSNSDAVGSSCSSTCTLKNTANGAATCGNASVDAGEECDDDNADENDSCLSNCRFNRCGDAARYIRGSETNGDPNPNRFEYCDDGNDNDGDSCLDTCMWNTCGDGHAYRKETDGDPNLVPDGQEATVANGLLSDCNNDDDLQAYAFQNLPSEVVYNDCDAPGTGGEPIDTSVIYPTAPSAAPDPGLIPEECEDGNSVNDDACNNRCQPSRCGDGILQAGELCDDGNTNGNDGCMSYDGDAAELQTFCDGDCPADDDACIANCLDVAQSCAPSACGDGFLGPNEACDDGNDVDTDECRNDCGHSTCGNGVDDGADEECDDGNSNESDACTTLCLYASCGDGFLQIGNGEECDDGNADNTDGCTVSCRTPICGDGVRQGDEACDPGRDVDGNEMLAPGAYLHASHTNAQGGSPVLSDQARDDGFIDEPFFCDPNTCEIRCDAQAGAHGRRWKENDAWCVFTAEKPGTLYDGQDFGNFTGALGHYTKYDEDGDYVMPDDYTQGSTLLDDWGWEAARAVCQDYGIGADLVVIRNATENDQFLAIIDGAMLDVTGGAYLFGYYWWIGLVDVGTDQQEPNGVWQWFDGSPDTFRNWSGPPASVQRPDGLASDEDCAAVASTDDTGFPWFVGTDEPGTWNDLACSTPRGLIACEFQIP